MAQSSDLESRTCVVWKTERPFVDRPRTSSNFCLLGFEWNLHMRYMYVFPTGPHYRIFLQQQTNFLHQEGISEFVGYNFRVTAFVEDSVHFSFPVLGRVTDVYTTSQIIWDFKEETVSKGIPAFQNYGELRVVCLFHDVPPSACQIKNETIYLRTQADQLSSAQDPNRLLTGSFPTEKCVQTSMAVPPDLESLSLDFSNLLEKEIFPDVKLRCRDYTIYAHRSILAARSQAFSAMFRNETMEKETDVIDIEDFDVPVVNLLLKYVYSGKIPDLTADTASKLFAAGDKYEMDALKKACSEWMIRNLNEENCVNFLLIADMHHDSAFKDAVISFICRHQGVMTTKTWMRFSQNTSELSNEVYHRFVTSEAKK